MPDEGEVGLDEGGVLGGGLEVLVGEEGVVLGGEGGDGEGEEGEDDVLHVEDLVVDEEL